MMMNEIAETKSNVKITFYYEDEKEDRPSSQVIRSDLDYIKKWYAWHPVWAHVDDRPVIFVWNAGGCDIAERWMEASNNEWYVVLKIFPDFQDCSIQPDHWVSSIFGTFLIQFLRLLVSHLYRLLQPASIWRRQRESSPLHGIFDHHCSWVLEGRRIHPIAASLGQEQIL